MSDLHYRKHREVSYLRWSDSDWYVFWTASKSNVRQDQTLAVWHSGTLGEDIDFPEFTWSIVREFVKGKHSLTEFFPDISDEDKELLLRVMQRWSLDVNARCIDG